MDKDERGFAKRILDDLRAIKELLDATVGLIRRPSEHSYNPQGHTYNDQTHAQPGANLIPSESAPAIASNTQPKTRKEKCLNWLTKWKPIFEIAGIGVVAVYTYVAARQLGQMIESNKIGREQLVSVQRAFVLFSPDAIEGGSIWGNGEPIRYEFYSPLQNSGVTPTRELVQHINWLYFPATASIAAPPTFEDLGTDESPFVLGPKDKTKGARAIVPPYIISGVQGGKVRLVFWGWAAYRDIFPNTPRHITMFCYEIAEILGDLSRAEGQIHVRYKPCAQPHDCADEECKGQVYGKPAKVWR